MRKFACTLFGLLLLGNMAAQGYNPEAIVPIDSEVKIGKLDNGLTYYIRKNNLPANRANMYIVHRVGARLEEDRQNGLAHFTEHMAFKGTTHFPGDAIKKYCEQNGIRFGANLNAFTSIDRTTYLITGIPLQREALMDSLLLVLHDWSGKFLFDPEMLETERGVIREERRTYGGPSFRINEQLNKALYNNSIYSKRNVIGDLDVLNTFKMNDILDFYHKWYRPDLQAVILVGDFDVEPMEAKVKKVFGDLPKPQAKLDYPKFDIPDNDDILFGTAIDPEAGNLNIRVIYKLEGTNFEDRGKEKYMYGNRIKRLINNMLSERLFELYLAKEQPFTNLSASFSEWIEDEDAFNGSVTPKKGEAEQSLKMLLTELERIKRYGFTEPELERAKAEILNQEQRDYNQRNNKNSNSFTNEYALHFTSNNSIPSAYYRFEFTKRVLLQITLDEVNQKAKGLFPDKNRVVTQSVSDNDKEYLLSEEQIRKLFADVKSLDIQPYKNDENKTSGKQLIRQEPQSGKIVKVKQLKIPVEVEEWTLSNGAKVVLYPTTHKDDQILLSSYSWGGFSLLGDEDFPSYNYATGIASMSGLGDFNTLELSKLMTGKSASAFPYIDETMEGINGSSSKKDMETMFQLLYQRFAQPRFDSEMLTTTLQRAKENIRQRANNPANHFNDSVSWITIGRHPRRKPLDEAALDKVNMPAIERIYKERFADAGDFVFFLVGSFTPEEIKPMVEKYIASLPGTGSKEQWKDIGIKVPKGKISVDFSRPMQTPKTSVRIRYSGDSKYDLDEVVNMDAIDDVLRNRYLETIRQKYGATYGVSVYVSVYAAPNYNYTMDINFSTDPKLADRMIQIIYDEIDKLVADGPDAETIENVKKHLLKTYADNQKNNGMYQYVLAEYYRYGIDRYTDYAKAVNGITPETVREMAKKALTQGNVIQVVMRPEE